jgi:hypothetical protein
MPFCQPLVSQPLLYYRGGRNAASLMPPDHPSGSRHIAYEVAEAATAQSGA